MLRLYLAFLCGCINIVVAAPQNPVTVAAASVLSPSTACGTIVNSCNSTFTAKQAYDCLVSVPFNAAVATRFLQYYNDTLQFQSTLSYLRNPPASYQQPAVDLLGGLEEIQKDIDANAFPNQYVFEAALQNLVYSAHDAHLQLQTGILAAFSFVSPYSLVSLSVDGIQLPKVYVIDDIALAQDDTTFTASAVKTINGQDTVSYLTQLAAANSFGNVEAHADWNDLMSSFASYIQDDLSILESSIEFYPGETMTLEFENGTKADPQPFYATYYSPGPTGPLSTGGDFYNFFVLGFYPASYDANAPDPCAASDSNDTATATPTSSSTAVASATSWPDSAYPSTADVFQPDLYPYGGGFLTGYFLKDISTAVLSIPTFYMSDNDIETFSDTVGKFLDASHAAGMQKILIDLQGNVGGDSLLAVDTYKHFFPSNDTYRGSRLRAHPVADVLGNTFTNYFTSNQSPNGSVYDYVAASAWTATDRLDATTNQNFTSWGAFFGPHSYNGDTFTTVQRENISSPVFDENALGIDIYGAASPATSPQYYEPANIAILTDGLCSSACAVFVEMMHHEAGVKTIVAGGLPQSGPMQAASGTRGAQSYRAVNIDNDIAVAEYFNASTESLLPNRQEDVLITLISVNLRDQIRKGVDVPTQFLYDAADCRIFYTADTYVDYSKLWTYASNAIFNDNKLCIPGSTGYASTSTTTGNPPPPIPSIAKANATALLGTTNEFTTIFTGFQLDKFVPTKGGTARAVSQKCNNSNKGCPVGNCKLDTSKPQGTKNIGGKATTLFNGVCPSVGAPAGGTKNLFTKQDQPPEIHHKRAVA